MTDRRRPFYTEYAWAFDLLIDRPVRKESAAIANWLVERGVHPGATLLDAGCGTGRYSVEMARRGYRVHGVDLTPELVAVANRSIDHAQGAVTFSVGDLLTMRGERYDALLCRGVLNDIIEDDGRTAAFDAFSRALRPGGVLILDVREWIASAERKVREPVFRKRVSTHLGELTFTSVTDVDHQNRRLITSERHALVSEGRERVSDYRFTMGCWTTNELERVLASSGFTDVARFGAYDPTHAVGTTDRIVVVAQSAAAA